jgi:hypothetical protein
MKHRNAEQSFICGFDTQSCFGRKQTPSVGYKLQTKSQHKGNQLLICAIINFSPVFIHGIWFVTAKY